MPSTYSPLKIELMATGEKNNTWGTITNTNLGTALEEAITGTADVTFASGNVTLTLTDTNATQIARNLRLNLTGTTAGARDLIVPAIEKLYFINNTCADTITVKNTTGTGIAVPAGKSIVVFNNATNVVDGITHLTSLTLASSLPVTSGGTGTTTSTGTGSVVLNNTPTLIAPLLGTPTSGVLTNATGLPISTGVSGLGTGVATFLGTPSSSNLAAAVTDETGSGALVFATSPTLVTPALGTPASGVLTNATGLPISTGVSGLGTGVATFLATPSSSNLAAAVTDETGSGALVFATSPTLVTPALGTPASGVLTNATGLPISTGVSGLGTGVATFLATPSSANLAAAVTDETGSGALVFGTSPTITSASLVTPALGTPASGVMTNVTGLPISTGVSGLGTGVATFLGTPSSANLLAAVTDETGTGSLVFATSPTLVTPVLGTPASATLTNATGLPISTGVSGLGTGVATFLGTPSSANLAAAVADETGSGSLVFATSPTLVTPNLGVPSFATLTNATGLPLTAGVTGTLPVANGGTGITSFGTGVATFLGTPSSANLAAAVTDETGSGSLVFGTSPTITSASLVTPALGTPASGVMTNVTGLPLTTGVTGTLPVANGGTGITSFGAGVATFLGTPSSANLAAAVTDETGSGSLVFATSPTLVTPALGTPASGVLTNVTGLPLTTGVTGTLPVGNGGTGVTTSTGTGSVVLSTSPTLVTPALGTPSSATLTNATGLPIGTGVSGLGTGVANFLATPSSANLAAAVTDETGSGSLVFATSPALVTPALGTPASGVMTNVTGLPLTTGVTGTLPVGNGGTGATTLTSNGVVYGNGTGAVGVTAVGATGQVLIGNTGAAPSWGAPPAAGVTSISFGSMGFLPNTATGGVISVSGTLAVANGGTGVTTSTGSGNVVLSTSPTLVTPALGTPSSATLTNATGLPISTGVSGLGTGVATFLATPSSANLAAAVTDETGSGALVFATSPTLVTPALGTPSSATLTNATGLPISTGVSGLGTGVATFLGTPSSANLAAAVTDETGTGALVFANTPTLVTPVLGAASATSLALAAGLVATPSLTFTGDPNTGMWSPAADIIAWSTAGSEWLRINASGYVGVNTTGPVAPFHASDGSVNTAGGTPTAIVTAANRALTSEGSLFSVQSTTAQAADMGGSINLGGRGADASSSATSFAHIAGRKENGTSGNLAGYLQFGTSDSASDLSERMRITSTGNVGIGTNNPIDKLHVVGGNASTLRIDNTGQQYTSADWYNNGASKSTIYYDNTGAEFVVRTTSSANIGFDTNLTRKMTILSDGSVGIGTTSPAAKLDVVTGTNSLAQQWQGAGTNFNLRLTSGNGATSDSASYRIALDYLNSTATNGFIDFYRGSGGADGYLTFGTAGTEKMRILANGNVGIGTSSPIKKLDVVKDSTFSSEATFGFGVRSEDIANYDTGIWFGADATNNIGFIQSQSGGSFSNRALCLQANGGNVGIETTSPAAKLHVTGTSQTGATYTDAGVQTAAVLIGSTNAAVGSGGALLLASLNDNGTQTPQAGLKLYLTNGTSNGTGSLLFMMRPVGSDTALTERMRLDHGGSLLLGTTLVPASSGTGVLVMGAVSGTPTAVSAGGALYVDSGGILKYRNSTNVYTVTLA